MIKNMKSTIKKIVSVLCIITSVFMIIGVVLIMLGLRPFILSSSSMEPLYHKGSLVLVDTKVTPGQINIGDVVAYRSSTGSLVLHRYVGKGKLQGDANKNAQKITLDETNLVGREVFTLPWFGSIVTILLKRKAAVLILAGVLILIACLPCPARQSHDSNISQPEAKP